MKELLKDLLTLLNINCRISSIIDFEPLLHEILLQAVAVGKCDAGYIFIVENEDPQLKMSLNALKDKKLETIPPSYSEVIKGHL